MKSTIYHPRCRPGESCHIQGPCDTSGRRTTSLTRTIQTKSSLRPPDKDPIDSHGRPDPDRVEADELLRRPDPVEDPVEEDEFQDPDGVKADELLQIGRDNRVPTCNSPPAVRVQDPGQPKHSQFHLFPSTPAHYRVNAHRHTDLSGVRCHTVLGVAPISLSWFWWLMVISMEPGGR
ncbi:hypothetical protein EYF80_068216 [Liparis tanakae]|uniref:Uncharacterized protein n=1 Tax=Liparis tanakae TaxID=230148 RepID=A0A4Z2DZV1_9TELE|nr:hypothetical protein EYF80_068216 [Liparis tanakae]